MATGTTTSSTSIFSATGKNPSLFSEGIGAAAGVYSAYKSFTGPDINYDILKLKANQKELEAQDVELKTQQDANHLRDQFSEAAGSYQYGTARRGVKVGEGSARQNIESSARDIGYDIQTMTGNAKFKADQLRAEGDRLGKAAGDQREVNKWEKLGNLMDSINKLSSIEWTKKTKTTTTNGKKTTTPVKKKTIKTAKGTKVIENPVETIEKGKTYGPLSMKTSGAQGILPPEQFNLADNPGGDAYHGGPEIGTIDATKMSKLSDYHKSVIAQEMAIDGENYVTIAKKLGLTASQIASIIDNGGTV